MQNNFEQIEIKNMIPESSSPPPKKFGKGHLLKFGLIFLVILIIVGAGYFVWDGYFSPSARIAHEMQANYQKFLDQQANYQAAMKADTYGGSTPQDTLDMFVKALKNNDVDSAANYFMLDDDGTRNPLVKANIQKLIDGNGTQKLLDTIKNLVPSAHKAASSNTEEFVAVQPDGVITYSMTLKLNEYSNVWKIENM